MSKKRVTLYVNAEIYEKCQELLAAYPDRYPISGLIEDLLKDWYDAAHIGPQLPNMSPEERLAKINEMATEQFISLADEVKATVRKARREAVES